MDHLFLTGWRVAHVPGNDRRRVLERARQEHGSARGMGDALSGELCRERVVRNRTFGDALEDCGHAAMPNIHHCVNHGCQQEWYVSALLDLDQIREEDGA